MRLFLIVIILSTFSSGCGSFSTEAQIRATSNGMIANSSGNQTNPNITNITKNTPDIKKNTPNIIKNTLDISTVDFKNFTFPDFDNKSDKTFTLKNGKTDSKVGAPKYTLRKTYYFDLTGDDNDEATTQILLEGCDFGCESSSLFYVHTAENNQPKLLWKVAVGGDVLGGLKAVNFRVKEIILEAFGDCSFENGVVKANVDIKNNPKLKTTNYTRFVFSLGANGYTQTDKDVLPLATSNIAEYRPQISFGEQ